MSGLREEIDSYLSAASEERLNHLDVAGHSDPGVGLQRFAREGLRVFAIVWRGAIQQHHGVKTPYIRLLDNVWVRFGLLHRDSKMIFGRVPVARGDCGNSGSGLRK